MAFFLFSIAGLSVKAQETAVPDTILVVNLKEAEVTGTRLWENDTLRYRYNQMKSYVKVILPYLDEATLLFTEINNKLEDEHLSKRQKRKYIKSKEGIMRERFEDKVKNLNTTQGVLLIKLISRQTHLNLYEILGKFKGNFTAIRWQAWARVNGFNLNKTYNPAEEINLEHIMEGLGYPLPASYNQY